MQEKVKEEKISASKKASVPRVSVSWRTRLRAGAIQLFFLCSGWLLCQAEMLFESYPLGLALLCASPAKYVLSVLAGAILSGAINMDEPVLYICTYAVVALVRIASSVLLERREGKAELPPDLKKKLNVKEAKDRLPVTEEGEATLGSALKALFNESVFLRMSTGAVSSMILSLYCMIVGGFQYYDLFAMLFLLVVTPAAIFVFAASMDGEVRHEIVRGIAQGALVFSLVWSAVNVSFLGLPLAASLALFFTLYAADTRGYILGVCAGLLCGLAYDPIQTPSFLLAALAFSLMKGKGRAGAGTVFAAFAMLSWSVYVKGALSLLVLLPAGLLAGTAFSLWQRLEAKALPSEEEKQEEKADVKEDKLRAANARCQDSNDRFRGISDAFASLSEMLYNLSDRFRRPGTLDLRHICDSSFDAYCQNCPNRSVCWGLEYSATLGTVNSLISQLHTKGRVTKEQISPSLARRCDVMDSILKRINAECARLTGEMLKNNRTEIFAMDYESAARIINDALEEDDGEYRFDEALEQKVRDYLSDAGIASTSVSVYGNRRRQIVIRGADVEHSKVTVEVLRSDLGEMCGLVLGRPDFEIEDHVSVMTLQAKKKIAVHGAQNNVSADGGVSGDSLNLFSNKKDYFYALVSDGMGAGKEAAFTSGLCSVFLEKMLRAGNRASTSLRMLNNMIRERDTESLRECSSTVDLLELDLITGEASFIKSGAAPSFVIRGSVVHRLQSGTAPIGIIRTLDMQQTPFSLKVGDTVVMISDGILQNDEECEQLIAYLKTAGAATPEEIVYRICLQASAFADHDDCSAIALRIGEAE